MLVKKKIAFLYVWIQNATYSTTILTNKNKIYIQHAYSIKVKTILTLVG